MEILNAAEIDMTVIKEDILDPIVILTTKIVGAITDRIVITTVTVGIRVTKGAIICELRPMFRRQGILQDTVGFIPIRPGWSMLKTTVTTTI